MQIAKINIINVICTSEFVYVRGSAVNYIAILKISGRYLNFVRKMSIYYIKTCTT